MRMVFTRDYSSVGSYFVDMQLLRLLNATWGPQLEYQEGKVFRVQLLVFNARFKALAVEAIGYVAPSFFKSQPSGLTQFY